MRSSLQKKSPDKFSKVDAWLLQANQAYQRKDYNKCLQLAKKAIELLKKMPDDRCDDPRSQRMVQAYELKADSYNAKKNDKKTQHCRDVASIYRQALNINQAPTTPASHVSSASSSMSSAATVSAALTSALSQNEATRLDGVYFTNDMQLTLPNVDYLNQNTKPKSSIDLALWLRHSRDTNNERYQNHCRTAMDMINYFISLPIKNRDAVAEILPLAMISQPQMNLDLLEALTLPIRQDIILRPFILEGIAEVISYMNPELIDADDLIQLLKVITARLQGLHTQQDSEKVEAIFKALCPLLDAMVDANVVNIDGNLLSDPLYKLLKSYKNHKNPRIRYYAEYAKEALLRLPVDETKLHATLRQLLHVTKGFCDLADAVLKMSISSLLSAIESFSTAAASLRGKNHWYDGIRIAQLLLKTEQFTIFEHFVNSTEYNQYETFNIGLIHLLDNVILTESVTEIQTNAMRLMASRLDMQNVQRNDTAKTLIHTCLTRYSVHHSNSLQTTSLALIEQYQCGDAISNITSTVAEQDTLPLSIHVKLGDKPLFPTVILEHVTQYSLQSISEDIKALSASSLLKQSIDVAQSVTQKIDAFRTKVLSDPDINDELQTYIPARGARSLKDHESFDLESQIETFLSSEKMVLLLTGHAGAGKSTYLRFAERQLWSNYPNKQVIPLFISLPSLQSPTNNMMNEILMRIGFTADEILHIKNNHQLVLFLDAYDEVDNLGNVIVSNQLREWNAHVVISCRTEYLQSLSTYQKNFIPLFGEKANPDQFSELTVVPFTKEQISAYINKFIQLHPDSAWTNEEQYQQAIDLIPGLRDLLSTPFLLMITMHVLPTIVEKNQDINDIDRKQITQATLYDEFIQSWFAREEHKLIASGRMPSADRNVVEEFWDFNKTLAKEMCDRKVTVIHYAPARSTLFQSITQDNSVESPWEKFFTNANIDIMRARRASPIRRLEPYVFGYIHPNLLTYFATKAMYDEQNTLMSEIQFPNLPSETVGAPTISTLTGSADQAALLSTVGLLPNRQSGPPSQSLTQAVASMSLNPQ